MMRVVRICIYICISDMSASRAGQPAGPWSQRERVTILRFPSPGLSVKGWGRVGQHFLGVYASQRLGV